MSQLCHLRLGLVFRLRLIRLICIGTSIWSTCPFVLFFFVVLTFHFPIDLWITKDYIDIWPDTVDIWPWKPIQIQHIETTDDLANIKFNFVLILIPSNPRFNFWSSNGKFLVPISNRTIPALYMSLSLVGSWSGSLNASGAFHNNSET